MRKVVFATLALLSLAGTTWAYADDESLPDIPAVDTQEQLPPLVDSQAE